MVELLLQRDEVDVNAKDRNGRSPLVLGSRRGTRRGGQAIATAERC